MPRYCRTVSEALAAAMAEARGMMPIRKQRARAARSALPRAVVLALASVLAWDLVVRAFDIPPYVLPSPGLVLRDAWSPTGRCCGRRCW